MTRSNVQNSANREFGPSRNISSARSGGATTAATAESGAGCIGISLAINGRFAPLQYFRRMWLGRIFSSLRYLATVRRAIGMPRSLKISTIS